MTQEEQEANAKRLWQKFKGAFAKQLMETEANTICTLWHDESDNSGKQGRTRLYDMLLSRVAKALDLEHSSEILGKVDHVIYNRDGVPQIIIESENETGGVARDELPKLCALSAPVRGAPYLRSVVP